MRRLASLLAVVVLLACERGGGEGAERDPAALRPKKAAVAAAPPDAGWAAKAAVATPATCPPIEVTVKQNGIWIRDQNSQSVVAHCRGEIDRAALALRLCTVASAAPPRCTAVSVAADQGVEYRQLVAVMDAALSAGLPDVGLADPGSLSLPLRDPPDPTDRVAPGCKKELPTCPPRPAATGGSDITDPIVITVPANGSVYVGDKRVATAREAAAGARIEPLYRILREQANPDGSRAVLLQVDRRIHARVVTRVIDTAKAAGFQKFAFAVAGQKP